MTEGQRSCAYEGCNRAPHETSSDGHCIFHARAEDKTIEDFRQALEKYLSELQEAKDAVYDFAGFIFPGDIDFRRNFGLNVFKRADFTHATFEGRVWFQNATFEGEASFGDATFKGGTSFRDATFKGGAWFTGATFKRGASFQNATFEGEAWFENTTFMEMVN